MNDLEYFGNTKAVFHPLDLDSALESMYTHMDILKTSKMRRMLSYFTDTKSFERGHKRLSLEASTLIDRFLMY